jgi:hypothetical protein
MSNAVSLWQYKLQANSATRNEHMDLRERVARMEPLVQSQLPECLESTKKLVESSLSQLGRLDTLEGLAHHSEAELGRLGDRANRAEAGGQANRAEQGRLAGELSRLGQLIDGMAGELAKLRDSDSQEQLLR